MYNDNFGTYIYVVMLAFLFVVKGLCKILGVDDWTES